MLYPMSSLSDPNLKQFVWILETEKLQDCMIWDEMEHDRKGDFQWNLPSCSTNLARLGNSTRYTNHPS